jgi:hypothetical protein
LNLKALAAHRQRWARAGIVAVYLALLVGCGFAAYYAVFGLWAYYDDAGYNEYTLKLFLDGHALYSHVFTYIGPFYYEFWGALFKIVGGTVTTDRGNGIETALWVIASLSVGLSVHRLTGRFALGVISFTTAFALLWTLVSEPMQSDSLGCALMVAFLVTVAFGLPKHPRATCILVGVLSGAVLLTKINLGAYALASVGFAGVMSVPGLARRRALRWLGVCVFVGIGPAVMTTLISDQWTQYAIALTLASTVSLVFVATPNLSPAGSDEDRQSVWWPVWFGAGFMAMVTLVLGVIFAAGSTPAAVWHSIVVIASHQSTFLTEPLNISDDAVTWSILLAGLAWAVGRTRRDRTELPPSAIGGSLRLLVGVAVLFSLVQESPFDLPGSLFALAMPLAWVVAVPPLSTALSPAERIMRLALPALAINNALISFPVAGTQVNTGSVLFVACGAICLSDGWKELGAWSASPENANRTFCRNLERTLGALFAAFALVTAFEHVL